MSESPRSANTVLLKGGRVIDETGERIADVLVRDAMIVEVAESIAVPAGARVLDASDAVVAPGLVDLQVHFREPGREDSETIETGARGAALGGFTAVVCMPNTDPPLDDAAVVQAVLERGRDSMCDVRVAGCITRGRAGRELAPLGELYDIGVRVFTDDGDCVADAGVMRRALEYSTALPGAVIAQHAEDPSLVAGGHMHEGEWSSRLGIPGRPAEAETIIVARDLALAERAGARYHVLHLSTAGAADLVRDAKARGVRVTAEASPQHFTLTHEACAGFDPVFAHGRRRRGSDRGPGRRHDRRHRDRPRASRAGDEGGAVRGGPAGHARNRDRARGGDHPLGRAGAAPALGGARAPVVAARPGRVARGARWADRRRPSRPPLRDRSRGHVGRRRVASREPLAQLAVRRLEAHRPGPAHRVPRRTGRHRRSRNQMSEWEA